MRSQGDYCIIPFSCYLLKNPSNVLSRQWPVSGIMLAIHATKYTICLSKSVCYTLWNAIVFELGSHLANWTVLKLQLLLAASLYMQCSGFIESQ